MSHGREDSASAIMLDELLLLREWRDAGKLDLIRNYLRLLPYRRFDLGVDSAILSSTCRNLLAGTESPAVKVEN